MKKNVSTHEAKTHLSRLIEQVIAGAEITICRGKSPVAKIVGYKNAFKQSSRPKVGVRTSPPVRCLEGAFTALSNDDDLTTWGMK